MTGATTRTLPIIKKLHGFKGRIATVDSGYGRYWINDSLVVTTQDSRYSVADFDEVGFSEGLMPAYLDNAKRWGYLNERFEEAVPFTLEGRVSPFHEGRAILERDGRSGAIDRTGRIVIKPRWAQMGPFAMARAVVVQDGKRGFVDTLGAVIVEPQYDEASSYARNGLAIVRAGNSYRLIDRAGKTVLESARVLRQVVDDSLVVTPGAKRTELALMDVSGRMINDTIAVSSIGDFHDGLALARGIPAAGRVEAERAIAQAAIAANRAVLQTLIANDKAKVVQAQRDSIAEEEKKRPKAVASDGPPEGKVRYVYYIVRQSIAVGTRRVQLGATTMNMRSVTWYVDYGFADAKPGMTSSAITRLFSAPRRSLTLVAGEGVFVLEPGAGSPVDQAMKRSGVGKTDADLLDDGFMGKVTP